MIVDGTRERVDRIYDKVDGFFCSIKCEMSRTSDKKGKRYDVPIREGEVFMLPAHVRHGPQRPQEGSIGLVVESPRVAGMKDGFEWFCFECGGLVHRIEVEVSDIVKDLPPLYEAFYADEEARKCPNCGAIHPGKIPPPGWAEI